MISLQANSEEQITELEKELEIQKNRFIEAAQSTSIKLQEAFSITQWIQEYPIHTAVFMLVGGFVTSQILYTPQSENPSQTQVKN